MPIAVDLAKVPVGSWAEYRMVMGTLPPTKMRVALVARSAGSTVVETTLEGGMLSANNKMVMHMALAPGADAAVKTVAVQVGANDPMDLPLEMTGTKPFTRPKPKTLVGSETVKTANGTYKAKHYREKTAEGDKIDYWVSEGVLPLGLVKIEVEQKDGPNSIVRLTMDLTGTGKEAKPALTKPTKPFDQAALMKQVLGAGAGAAGAGAGAAGAGAPKPGPGPAAPSPTPPAPPKK
jgi:hypothetical protein